MTCKVNQLIKFSMRNKKRPLLNPGQTQKDPPLSDIGHLHLREGEREKSASEKKELGWKQNTGVEWISAEVASL